MNLQQIYSDLYCNMNKIYPAVLLVLFAVSSVHCIFPTPKNARMVDGEFLEIGSVCNMRLVLPEDDSSDVLAMFQSQNADSRYYLTKILKRKNNNLHCANDRTLIEDDQSMIDIQVQVDPSKVSHKQGYILSVARQSPHITITVNSYSGYVYALETLSQMIKGDKIQIGQVEDQPLVVHRGVMIDSARHFLKVQTIAKLIESMPLSKLNILHWHLSDDESFTLQLASHPELAESSAFKHGQFYTLDQAKMLIDLAKQNGVTIMPEIDTPAHVRSWGLDKKWAQQNITITCPRGQGYNGQFDVSKAAVYQLAQQVYKEIDNLFRDAPYIHLGGDEVFGACWDLRPAIQTFMATKGLKDYGELQMYWRYQMKQALPQNRSVVFWRNDAQNLKLADNDIIHFWGAQADIPKILNGSNSRIILSPSDLLYINKGIGNIWFNSSAGTYSTWKQIYQGFNVFPEGINKDRILGAEVTLWGEVSNDDTLENNIWMRATAFGEKLWSDQVRTTKELVKEIVMIENELIKMGVNPSPIVSEFCEKFTDNCLLS